MSKLHIHIKFCLILILICGCLLNARAQDPKAEKPKEDVLRVTTNLIQTGVAVFDKKGRFVDKLRQEDFELRVDGKPVPISFFEYKGAEKTTSAETKSEPQSKEKPGNASNAPVTPTAPVSGGGGGGGATGRKIIFLVDDIHLSFDSQRRTKELILKFIDRELLPEDFAAVVSTKGKIGELQQFTKDKAILRAAVQRLAYSREGSIIDRFSPPMSEYEAQLIDRRDAEVTDIYAAFVMKESPGTELEIAREQVRSRARSILFQAEIVSKNTYSALEQTVRQSGEMPGRKIVLFFSDGFLLDLANTNSSYRLQRITDAAVRSNAVIYSFDTKGLDAGFPGGDLSETKSPPSIVPQRGTVGANDTTVNTLPRKTLGAELRIQAGERLEAQDGLNLLADSTGGRFIHNTNDLQTEVTKVVKEASVYYLLAWEPDSDNVNPEKLRRIEVSVRNRPDLNVRMQKGYLDAKPGSSNKNPEPASELPQAPKAPVSIIETELNSAIQAQTPKRELPISVAVNYIDTPKEGAVLAAVLQLKSDAIEFTPKAAAAAADEATAGVDLFGVIYNSNGKRETSFRKFLTLNVPADRLEERADIYYNYQTKLKPGLYQLKVAARDAKSGRTGSDFQSIEIPDLSLRKLSLSSLLLSEQSDDPKPRQVASEGEFALGDAAISVDRQFSPASQLRFLIFIYNAARGQAGGGGGGGSLPDVTLQTQILRGTDILITSPPDKVSVEEAKDPTRLFYAADIPLKTLPAGRYELQVTVNDRIAKTKAVQHASFEIK